ncbi:MAG: VOC family protein, partial [Gemmatimonadota bacterium]|nr:VOC family protein [Gemmatimonadota bacterium]
ILTPDPAGARAFYADVLGWTFKELPGVGYGIQAGGVDVGGMFDVVSPRTPDGTRPVMAPLVKVDSADATARIVRKTGGRAEDPFDVADAGRIAVCADPLGASFDVWEPRKLKGTTVDTAAHGAPSWIENLTTDPARAAEFYCGVFGWTAQLMPMGSFDYTVLNLGDEGVAGMMQIRPDMGDGKLPPHWGVYVTVDDLAAAARAAERAGGSVCVPLQKIPGVGRFCGLASPHGVIFYAIAYAM